MTYIVHTRTVAPYWRIKTLLHFDLRFERTIWIFNWMIPHHWQQTSHTHAIKRLTYLFRPHSNQSASFCFHLSKITEFRKSIRIQYRNTYTSIFIIFGSFVHTVSYSTYKNREHITVCFLTLFLNQTLNHPRTQKKLYNAGTSLHFLYFSLFQSFSLYSYACGRPLPRFHSHACKSDY